MYIDSGALTALAGEITALGIVLGAVAVGVRFVLRDRRQTKLINEMRGEQSLICFGVLACLKGLKEQGCNGPVNEALNKLEKHLNRAAHGELPGE